MFIDELSCGVMDNVLSIDTFIVGLDPGIDPERLDADDFFLLVGHGAGYVHHVNDDGDAFGLEYLFPAAILLVLADRHHHRSQGVVDLRRNLPSERTLEGALEVPQGLGTGLTNARITIAGGDDMLFAARPDARQGEF